MVYTLKEEDTSGRAASARLIRVNPVSDTFPPSPSSDKKQTQCLI